MRNKLCLSLTPALLLGLAAHLGCGPAPVGDVEQTGEWSGPDVPGRRQGGIYPGRLAGAEPALAPEAVVEGEEPRKPAVHDSPPRTFISVSRSGTELIRGSTDALSAFEHLGARIYDQPVVRSQVGDDDDTVVATDQAAQYPWSTATKLKSRYPNGKTYGCTGTLVGPYQVLTAGHCIYNEERGGWVESVKVIPGYSQGNRPYGTARDADIWSLTCYTTDVDPECDIAVIVLDRNIGNFTGYLGRRAFDDLGELDDRHVDMNSFPAAPMGDGQTMFNSHDIVLSVSSARLFHAADSEGGSSGGGLYQVVDSKRYVVAVHTHGGDENKGVHLSKEGLYAQVDGWIHSSPPPLDKPDLSDSGAGSVSAQAIAGEQLSVSFQINNQGTAAAADGLVVRFYLSEDDEITAGDRSFAEVALPELPALHHGEWTRYLELPGDVAAGFYHLGWRIDPEDVVDELDEDNNIGVAAAAIQLDNDLDADGYNRAADCDDTDAAIHPGAEELCDGVDNNCDEAVDEGCGPSCTPSGEEICDGQDNDCNGLVDDGCKHRRNSADDDSGGCTVTAPPRGRADLPALLGLALFALGCGARRSRRGRR